jgi:hypothetical protein
MAYFLTREDGGQQVGGRAKRAPPAPVAFGGENQSFFQDHPTSPLSRFVQEGYTPAPVNQQGFDAGIAQQWNSDVQQTRSVHQQQNDPNYIEKKVKSHGYRVSHAPGGASSISLSWDDNSGSAESMRRGRGSGLPPAQPVGAAGGGMAGCLGGGAWGAPANGGANNRPSNRVPSPGSYANGNGPAGIRRSSSRDLGGGMGACLGGANQSQPSSRGSMRAASPGARMSNMAYDSRAAPSHCGVQYGGGGVNQQDANSLVFGSRVSNMSSNAYANGANQNCGNSITDRRTTRVLQPPGGSSQICFG